MNVQNRVSDLLRLITATYSCQWRPR